MKQLLDTDQDNVKFYITDDHDDDLIDEWLWLTHHETKDRQPQSLNDNPYHYEYMRAYQRDYNVLYLKDNKPWYGYYLKKCPQVAPHIIRKLRAYNLNRENQPLLSQFWKTEHWAYEHCLKPILDKEGISIMFFTRHVDANGAKEMKWRQRRQLNRLNLMMYSVNGIKIKGFLSNVHYHDLIPRNHIMDHSFVLNFHKV